MDLDVSLERILGILEAQVALTAAEQRHEDVAEVLPHLHECLQEELASRRIYLANGLLQRVLRRIEVVALGRQEAEALRFLLVLLDCQRIDRSERLQLFADKSGF